MTACRVLPPLCVLQIGMVEAIAQLVHKDYSAIVDTFVTLEFIPAGTDLKPILPVLAKARSLWRQHHYRCAGL